MGHVVKSVLGGGSSSSGKSSSQSNPWAPAQSYLKDILGQAQTEFNQQGGINANAPQQQVAGYTGQMQTAINNLMSSGNLQNVANTVSQNAGTATSGLSTGVTKLGALANQATSASDINNYAGQLYNSDLVKNQVSQLKDTANEQMAASLQDINQGAVQSGNMGSSRAGVASAVTAAKINKDLSNSVTNLQDQARQEAITQAQNQLNANTQNQQSAASQLLQGGLQGNQQQAALADVYQKMLENQMTGGAATQTQAQNIADVNYQNAVNQQNAGYENLAKYANLATGIGGLGGSSTATQSQPGQSTTNKVLGLASTAAGLFSMFSDASLKENVKRVGTDQKGNPRYTWDWNEDAGKMGLKGKGSGVLAQQVAKTDPEAVQQDAATGKLKVDYSQVGGVSAKPKKKKK